MADSTQFLIDMVAKLTGGDTSVATLATLGDTMLKTGATAQELEKTIGQMSTALEESGTAQAAANKALAEGEQRYKQAEIAAERAFKAVEKLNASGKSGDAFAKKQAEAVEKAQKAGAALMAEAAAVDILKAKANAAAASQVALSKGLKNVESAAQKAAAAEKAAAGTGKAGELAAGLASLGGPLGVAGQKVFGFAAGFEKLGKSIGSVAPYLALAVGIVAIATAAIAATFAVTNFGVSLADANRTQTLLSAGIARSTAGGEELEATIAKLGNVVPQSSDELRSMAAGLANAGLRGKDLTAELERSAIAAAQLKWGPDFQKQLLAIDVQTRRLKENIATTFGGLGIEKLLGGMQTLVNLFDASTESGHAMQVMFGLLFQPIVDGAASAAVKVERLFILAEILALEAYIALKPYRTEIEAVGKAFLVGAAVIVASFAAALLIVVGAVAAVVGGIGLLVVSINQLIDLVPEAIDLLGVQLRREFENIGKIGGEIIDGMINGINDGALRLKDSLVSAVTGGVDAVKHFLHIGSPSKLMFDMGVNTTEGFSGGVESGSDDTQAALESMVAPPKGKAGAAGAGGTSMGGVTIQISVDGRGESDEGLAKKIADAVRSVFETDALMLGAGEEPAT